MLFELSDKSKITKNTMVISIIIGISATMGLLTHGGVAFSFIALGFALLCTEKRLTYLKHAGGAVASFIVVYLPWVLFQRLVDPPGNRLVKWHFAGMQEVNDYSLLEALSVSYADRPISDIINKTIVNIFHMFTDFPSGYMSVQALKDAAFFKLFGMAAILNAFIVILALYFVKKYCIDRKQMSFIDRTMFYFTVFSFVVWSFMMYLYQYTNINLGSYVNIILIYILIAYGAKHTNKELRNVLFAVNIILFILLPSLPARHW
jgi:hypothetical protein